MTTIGALCLRVIIPARETGPCMPTRLILSASEQRATSGLMRPYQGESIEDGRATNAADGLITPSEMPRPGGVLAHRRGAHLFQPGWKGLNAFLKIKQNFLQMFSTKFRCNYLVNVPSMINFMKQKQISHSSDGRI